MPLEFLKNMMMALLGLKSPPGTNGTIRNSIQVLKLKILTKVKLRSFLTKFSNLDPPQHKPNTSNLTYSAPPNGSYSQATSYAHDIPPTSITNVSCIPVSKKTQFPLCRTLSKGYINTNYGRAIVRVE